jgi:uncharacterized protein (UPF0332 family)
MNEDIGLYLQTARETLEDASILISQRRFPAAVSRAYYAMFYAASAMLLSLGLKVESHYGMKVKFGEMLVKTEKVDRRFGEMLTQAYDLRQDADYVLGTRAGITRQVAEREYKKANDFLRMAEQFLKGAGGKVEQ